MEMVLSNQSFLSKGVKYVIPLINFMLPPGNNHAARPNEASGFGTLG